MLGRAIDHDPARTIGQIVADLGPKRRRGFERLVGQRADGHRRCRSDPRWGRERSARAGYQAERRTSREARLFGSSQSAGASRQGIDKIDQLAELVRANSDGLIGAFHLVDDQQPRGDPGAVLDERTFDRGIEPQRHRPLQPRQKPRAIEPFRHDRDKPPAGRQAGSRPTADASPLCDHRALARSRANRAGSSIRRSG
jgi:hypothetical protein